MELPVDYRKLSQKQRREVRLQYIAEQSNMCMYCGGNLSEIAPVHITRKSINWKLFSRFFRPSYSSSTLS